MALSMLYHFTTLKTTSCYLRTIKCVISWNMLFSKQHRQFKYNTFCIWFLTNIFLQLIPIQKCTLQKSDDKDFSKNNSLLWYNLIMSALIVVDQPAGYIALGSTEVNFIGFIELYNPGFDHDKSKKWLTVHSLWLTIKIITDVCSLAKLLFVYDSINYLFTETHECLTIKSNQSLVGKVLELTFFYCFEQEKEPVKLTVLSIITLQNTS